jgi:prolyl oligopeptidase
MTWMSRRSVLSSLAIAAAATGHRALAAPAGPPVARVAPVTDTYFGTPVVDDYRWMETFPRTEEWNVWLKGQADHARRVLDALPDRPAMVTALKRYADAFDFVSVRPAGARLFLMRVEPNSPVPRLFVADSTGGQERLLYDPAGERRPDGPPVTLDWYVPSPDGALVALGIGEGGSEITATWIMDVTSGARVKVTPFRSKGAGWSADGKAFFYYRVRADAVPGSNDYELGGSCWMHRIGADPAADVEVLRSGEGPDFVAQEDDTPVVHGAPGSDWVMGVHLLNGFLQTQLYVARAAETAAGKPAWRKVVARADGVVSAVLSGDSLYLLANARQSNGEVVRVDLAKGQTFATGAIVLPAGDAVIDTLTAGRDGVYAHTLRDGQGGVIRIRPNGKLDTLKPPLSGAIFNLAASPLADGAWYGSDDLTRPAGTFHIDAASFAAREVMLQKLKPLDASRYVTERAEIKTRDGALVPIELLRRQDLPRDGRAPTLIEAYGAYGTILDPGFQSPVLAFLDAGGIVVYAHVRGGGEKGEAWHQAGMKATKPNTWRDVIDVALALIQRGWTRPGALAVEGTSAGGVMAGRALTERPDLFGAVIGNVGLFDAVRFELTPNGKGNDAEFGTVKREDEFHALLAMDSIRAVKAGQRYPAVLLTTGANDRRVEPWIVGKFAATLQAKSSRPDPALLSVNYQAGHYTSDRDAAIAKQADAYAFVLAHTR